VNAAWLAAARVVPLVALMPALGRRISLPRAVLAALLVAMIAPGLAGASEELGPAVVRELAIGLTLGVASTLPFHAAALAGRALDLAIGPQAQARRPDLLRDAYLLFAVAIFCALGGLDAVLGALVQSYAMLPIGSSTPGTATVAIKVGARLIACGVGVAAPVLAALLLIDVSAALLTRAQPLVGELFGPLALRRAVGVALLALTLFSAERQLARAPMGASSSVDEAVRAVLGDLARSAP
jgi:flagellar biosynthetic protein FliR